MKNNQVLLVDDGTMDTVVSVDGCQHRYDAEFSAQFRDPHTGAITAQGWDELRIEAVNDHADNCQLG